MDLKGRHYAAIGAALTAGAFCALLCVGATILAFEPSTPYEFANGLSEIFRINFFFVIYLITLTGLNLVDTSAIAAAPHGALALVQMNLYVIGLIITITLVTLGDLACSWWQKKRLNKS